MDYIFPIVTAIISGGLFSFITFLINRKDNIQEKLDTIEERLKVAEKDSLRTQMLILMNHYPNDRMELMRLAEHYFRDLNGDFYMTTLFNKYIVEKNIAKPNWFNEND